MAFGVAGAAQGAPEALRRAVAIMQAPEGPPSGVAHTTPRVPCAPRAIPLHLDAPRDADDVTDASRIEHGTHGSIGTATIRCPPHALRRHVWQDARASARDHGQCVALHPACAPGVVVGAPKDRHGTTAHHPGDNQQVLLILAGPVHGQTSTSSARHLTERPAAAPRGAVLRLEPFVVPQTRPALPGGFLVALGARACRWAAGLLVHDRGHERRDRFALMAVCPREECVDRVYKACRKRCCCHRQQVRTSRQLVPTRYVTKCVQTSGDKGNLSHSLRTLEGRGWMVIGRSSGGKAASLRLTPEGQK